MTAFDPSHYDPSAPLRRVRHPAKFSDAILEVLDGLVPPGEYLDPFAGTGRVHELQRLVTIADGSQSPRTTVGIEIQPQWAACHPQTVVGNALYLPADWTGRFDGIITSPTYGNRLADHHQARDASKRHSYTHDLRTMMGDDTLRLEPGNSGTIYFWDPEYASFHRRAWHEAHRVTRPDGMMFLNISNFIHEAKEQPVVGLHVKLLVQTEWMVVGRHQIGTPRLRFGENRDAHVDHEVILVARRT